MKITKKKLLSVLSAGLVAVQAVVPVIGTGVGAVAEENLVRKATPVIDGELDQEYASSYSVKLSTVMKANKVKLTAFQMQESAFNAVYFDEDDNPTGYIKIYAEDGSEITPEMFADEYGDDYSELPANENGSITCTFEWTDAGYASEYFADVTYSFLWDDEAVYVYASVKDSSPLGYTKEQFEDFFSSGWASRPWLIDCIYATLRFYNQPYTAYRVSDGNAEVDGDHPFGEIYVDEANSTPYSDITIIASGTGSGTSSQGKPVEYDGVFYYAQSGESYFDKETNSYVCDNKLTTLNDFTINWYEYTFFTDTYPGSEDRRALVCDGSDTVEGEKTCVEDFHTFLAHHAMSEERIAERDAGRAENLQNAAILATESGYVVEMKIPLTEQAFGAIKESENVIGFLPMSVNAMPLAFGTSVAGGNATRWLLNTTSGNAVSLKLTDEEYVYVPGDVNGDGNINSKDIVRLMQYIANDGNGVTVTNSDVNNDGKTNSKDIVRLMQYIANDGEGVEIF